MTGGGAERGKYHFLSSRVDQMLTEQFEESTPGDNNYCISATQKVTEGTHSHDEDVSTTTTNKSLNCANQKASSKTSSNPGDKLQNHVEPDEQNSLLNDSWATAGRGLKMENTLPKESSGPAAAM